ncbi:hypothetical protein L9F63_012021, partial [Diploptera punctata]
RVRPDCCPISVPFREQRRAKKSILVHNLLEAPPVVLRIYTTRRYGHLRSPAVCGTTRESAADCGRDEASPPPAAPPSAGFIHLRSPVYPLKEVIK